MIREYVSHSKEALIPTFTPSRNWGTSAQCPLDRFPRASLSALRRSVTGPTTLNQSFLRLVLV